MDAHDHDQFDISDAPGLVALILSILPMFQGKVSEGVREAIQKGVSVLWAPFTKRDEGIWLSLLAQLNKKQKDSLTRLLGFLDRFHEKDSFRLTVINAPVATMIVEDRDPKDKDKTIKRAVKVGEYSNRDTRVVFLKEIAQLVDDIAWGPKKVCDMLRTHELATENEIAKHALKFWNDTRDWMIKRVCALLEINSLSEITLAKVMGALNRLSERTAEYVNTLTDMIPDRPVADMTIGFWRHTFRHHPTQALALVIGIILTVAFFAIVSFNN